MARNKKFTEFIDIMSFFREDDHANKSHQSYNCMPVHELKQIQKHSSSTCGNKSSMKKLVEEYKQSLKALTGRINELNYELQEIKADSEAPEKDPDVIAMEERIKPLKRLLAELKEVTKEVERYYVPGHWRSEKLTCNKKPSYTVRYAPYINELTCESVHPMFSEVYQPLKR